VTGDLAYDFLAVRDSSVRGEKRDINALASVNDSMAAIMIWNYHDLNIVTPNQNIEISINGIPSKKVEITHFRVDQKFSNSYEKWKEMGSPQNVSEEQYKVLKQAGKLAQFEKPKTVSIKNGQYSGNLELPGQAVSLLILKWKN
jgi:xylan 1,4-beta-xylosidase